MRSLAAAQRHYEREAVGRQRELERQRTQLVRMEESERAAFEVAEFENHISVLLSVHRDSCDHWDWGAIHSSAPPSEPARKNRREAAAQAASDGYQPGIRDRLLRRVDTKRLELSQAVEEARKADEKELQQALSACEQECSDWGATRHLAAGILNQDPAALIQAIEQANPFGEISGLGSSIEVQTDESLIIQVSLRVNDKDVIPSESKKLLKSGKLSVRPMTKTNFFAAY